MSQALRRRGWAAALPGAWRDFAGFVARPALPAQPAGPGAAGLRSTFSLYALDVALMIPLVLAAMAAEALGLQIPRNAMEDLDFDAAWIAMIVIGAPLAEEVVFRGWLSGRPGHISAVALLVLGALATTIAAGMGNPAAVLAAAGMTLLLVVLALWAQRGKTPIAIFARYFRWIFYLSALAFAAIHLFNYDGGASAILVVPQLIAGLIFGYARVLNGLWSSMLLHALHNGVFLALALGSGQLQT